MDEGADVGLIVRDDPTMEINDVHRMLTCKRGESPAFSGGWGEYTMLLRSDRQELASTYVNAGRVV
jgi:hypothetical protein